LPAGVQRKLDSVASPSVKASIYSLITCNNNVFAPDINALLINAKAALKPGSYMAKMKDNPFVENPLAKARREGSLSIVIGTCRRDGSGS
jgi:hypothetical protein